MCYIFAFRVYIFISFGGICLFKFDTLKPILMIMCNQLREIIRLFELRLTDTILGFEATMTSRSRQKLNPVCNIVL